MFDRNTIVSTFAAAAFAALTASTATAGSLVRGDAVYLPAVIGAAYNDAARADSAADVRRQGGFATAGTMRWLAQAPETQAPETEAATRLIYVPSVIGAMNEAPSLARSADEVRHQGGFATAGTVRWFSRAPATEGQPLHTVAAF